MKRRWSKWLAGIGILVLGGFFLAIMRPPGGQTSAPGQDLPWQITRHPDGATITVFGLTLGQSALRQAVDKLGRRYELGVFQAPDGALSLEAYFRDALVGGLSGRWVLSAQLPAEALAALLGHASTSKPTAEGGHRYPVAEADQDFALSATVTAITLMPVAKFDADLVRRRFGEPAERIAAAGGMHWLYPERGLDLLLGDQGETLLQYVPPPEFAQRLRAPLGGASEKP